MNWKVIGIVVLITVAVAAAALGAACYLETEGKGCRVVSFEWPHNHDHTGDTK